MARCVPTNVTFDPLAKEGASFGLPPDSVAKIEDVRSQGLAALQSLHEAGLTMAYGSDLLGEMHQHQSDEFILRGEVLPAMRSSAPPRSMPPRSSSKRARSVRSRPAPMRTSSSSTAIP